MDKIEEAREILKFVGMPKAQQAGYMLLCFISDGWNETGYVMEKCNK